MVAQAADEAPGIRRTASNRGAADQAGTGGIVAGAVAAEEDVGDRTAAGAHGAAADGDTRLLGRAMEDMFGGGVVRTSMVLWRKLMLSRCRSAKSMPRMRRMGRSSTANHWMRKRQPWISATP